MGYIKESIQDTEQNQYGTVQSANMRDQSTNMGQNRLEICDTLCSQYRTGQIVDTRQDREPI